MVIAYWLEYGLSFVGNGDTQVRWRFPIAFQLLYVPLPLSFPLHSSHADFYYSPLIGLVIATFYMPESPRWLAKNGKKDEALEVLGRLRSEDGIVNEESQAEFNDIENALKLEAANSFSYAKMFFTSCGKLHMSRRVQLAIWIQILQEWTGIAGMFSRDDSMQE